MTDEVGSDAQLPPGALAIIFAIIAIARAKLRAEEDRLNAITPMDDPGADYDVAPPGTSSESGDEAG